MHDLERPRRWPPHWPDVTDPAVRAAIAAVPRHLFVPSLYRSDAYQDVPQPIGHGQTISQPYIVALMTQALGLTGDSRVLEIGTGSGYQAAVLSELTAYVWSVEAIPELAEAAEARLSELGYPVEVKVGDGCLGWPEHAPYDAIVVTAAAREVPLALVVQLADPGRLVIPVSGASWDQWLWLITKSGGVLRGEVLGEVRFVPLISRCSGGEVEEASLAALRSQLRDLLGHWRT
jgi:protein-L-isoaspartate(D-aspartate) O-methyltransferase